MENYNKMGAQSYSKGSATSGSEEATKYKKEIVVKSFFFPKINSDLINICLEFH